ncbi:MAG: type 4a pilus biogenesis protein PilO [Candidatus Omnitrophota bacterium]
MMLSKFSSRERMLIISTVTITVATLVYVFVIEPVIGAYSKINRQIISSTLKMEKGSRLLKRAHEINAEYAKYAELIKPSQSDEEEIASMLKVIEVLARENQIYIRNIRPEPVKMVDFYKEYIFELTTDASITDLGKFIYDIQTSGNLLRVKRLTLSSGSKGRDSLKAVLEISKPLMPAVEL